MTPAERLRGEWKVAQAEADMLARVVARDVLDLIDTDPGQLRLMAQAHADADAAAEKAFAAYMAAVDA
jgi:hypothetical protein